MQAVFILGAGVMQGPAIEAAKAAGYRTVVADANPRAASAHLADQFLQVDLKDVDSLIAAAGSIEGLAGVFTAGTDFSYAVARIAEAHGLPGIRPEAALDASDKARMRTRLRAAGLPVPAFAYGGSTDQPAELLASLLLAGAAFPLVVKPVDNMGGRGCRMVNTKEQLIAAWHEAIGQSRGGRAIIEEYVDGPEFSIDALVHEGRVVIRGIADRHIHFPPYFIEMGHTLPSAYDPAIQDELVSVFIAAVHALGLERGAAKGDIKYTRKGPVIGEIAARLSGGYMSGWTYPYASGVNPVEDGLAIACGRQPLFPAESRGQFSAERAFISIPGRVAELRGLEAARSSPGVQAVFSRVEAGSQVRFPHNNVEKCGNCIAVADGYTQASEQAEQAARSVLIRLAPNQPETDAFLAERGGRIDPDLWPPMAYQPSAILRGVVQALPDLLARPERGKAGPLSIGIVPLIGLEREASLDWMGRSLVDSLEAVQSLTGARLTREADLVVGRSFWQAVFAGGYQAGVYLLDGLCREYRS